MTKLELIKKVSAETGIESSTAETALESAVRIIKETVVKDEPIYLRGFGVFFRKRRRAKAGRNISKNTTIIIPEHDVPAFKPYDPFKKMLSGK